ncbi:helix-hairpin-helix domain-containing protein [Lapidilactobacillus bayanensis]|uniref:helix-hairpin-helix domain-containing protein n=1 Tax=Lapidilactobacillus bayanensis TaxID=2485998 RepID=UPI000F785E9A|nr:helix-hairpin-helix domain-containing protein [Lapidilactobacillus bayanensis]
MKNIWQRLKQVLLQQPLKYGSILVVILGLIVFGIIQQVQDAKPEADLAQLTAATNSQDQGQSAATSAQSTSVAERNAQQPSTESSTTPTKIYVEIKGEVARPDVYQVAATARINDLVKLAGGLTAAADNRQLNLAQPLQDGLSIYVPKKGEEALVQDQAGAPATSATTASVTVTGETGVPNKVNLNQADVTQLQQVSGIGPKKAADIIAYRETEGPFKSVDDLTKVSGIGDKTLAKIREQLCI